MLLQADVESSGGSVAKVLDQCVIVVEVHVVQFLVHPESPTSGHLPISKLAPSAVNVLSLLFYSCA